ncbi:hypothetical protein J4471_01865 [Candidatus Woesearchaeota archaeon]|nr:hypothetical protein [Candidatus Woesearchaeota archaeon]
MKREVEGANAMSYLDYVAQDEPYIFNMTIDQGCYKTIIFNGQRMTVNLCRFTEDCKH